MNNNSLITVNKLSSLLVWTVLKQYPGQNNNISTYLALHMVC